MDLKYLEKSFLNKDLLIQSLTHKSWVNEHPEERTSNERLEFLGDAVLEFIVSEELYRKFPDKEEGYLTALRANLVNTNNLSQIAITIGLGKEIYLSKGEEETGGRSNPSILADTVEALIGALYIDGGLKTVQNFLEQNLLSQLDQKLAQPLKDAKSLLQEFVQAKGYPAPKYEVIKEEGPDHAKTFTIQAKIAGQIWGKGLGKNKSEAAQIAAKDALKNIS